MPCAITVKGRVCGTAIGNRGEADDEPHVERSDQNLNRRDEPFPLNVRLGAVQQQERHLVEIVHEVYRELRRGVAGPVIGREGHLRAARSVVEQLIDVEADDQLRVQRIEQMFAGKPPTVAGIHETVERLNQHRPRQPGLGRLGG